MMHQHPLERLSASPAQRRALFRTTLSATLLVMAALVWVDAQLRGDASPHGIISFEFSWSLEGARRIMRQWDEQAKGWLAGFSLGLDFLWLPLYSTAIASALLLGDPTPWRRRLAWSQWLAALLDAVENVCLLALLGGAPSDAAAKTAAVCAAIKFALVLAGIAGGVWVLWVGRRKSD